MARRHTTLAAPPPDPFGEQHRASRCERLQLLGGRFEFETDSAQLLRIVHSAYAGLPAHQLGRRAPRLRVRLALGRARTSRGAMPRGEPGLIRTLAADAMLCGAMDGANFVALTPRERSALIVVARDTLRYAYHVRYEMLEFAVYVLAARCQGLVPLHAACLGRDDGAVLLLGASGAGKSTVVLHALLSGLDFLAEDSVLVRPQGLLATGLASYVHLRPEALRFFSRDARRRLIGRAARIRRRSGVEKLEIDLRDRRYRLAATPLPIRAVVFLSARKRSARQPLLQRLPATTLLQRLDRHQRYAAQQPGWREFRRRIARLPGYELRRDGHPRAAVEALRALLAQRGRRARREFPH